jgi:hypothetical protein
MRACQLDRFLQIDFPFIHRHPALGQGLLNVCRCDRTKKLARLSNRRLDYHRLRGNRPGVLFGLPLDAFFPAFFTVKFLHQAF